MAYAPDDIRRGGRARGGDEYVACEFFDDLKIGETFRLLGEDFAKLGPSVAVKIDGWYSFNENTSIITKDD